VPAWFGLSYFFENSSLIYLIFLYINQNISYQAPLWLSIGLLCLHHLSWAQAIPLQEQYPFSLLSTPAIVTLDQAWKGKEGNPISIPFLYDQQEDLWLSYTFDLNCSPQDTLYLYIEGASWRMEVEFNDRYLGLYESPLAAISIPLNSSWFGESSNHLQLHLSLDEGRNFYPTPFLGMLQSPVIVDIDQLTYLRKDPLPRATKVDTVGLIAPYYLKSAYQFDLASAYKMLWHLKGREIQYIYFLFPPGRELNALCAQLGFQQAPKIEAHTYTFFLNTYPYEMTQMIDPPRFWLDKEGYRTQYYDSYYLSNHRYTVPLAAHEIMVWMVLMPLIGLLLIKLFNPGFFYAMLGILTKPKLYIDNFSDASYSNLALIFVLQVIKVLCLATSISMILFYIQGEHQWYLVNIFREESLLSSLYRDSHSLLSIFSKTSFILFSWLWLKYIINMIIGNIYRIKSMALSVLNIDIVGSYPLVMFLSVPIALIIFSDTRWHTLFVICLSLIVTLYIVRKLFVFYMGLDKVFRFSFGVKILYICTFNILPYVIWL